MSVIGCRFSGKGRFSVWAADRSVNQILNIMEAACKAAFEYRGGHWMSKRMLFGWTNAPATFAHNMDLMIFRSKGAKNTSRIKILTITTTILPFPARATIGLNTLARWKPFLLLRCGMNGSSKPQKFISLILKSELLVLLYKRMASDPTKVDTLLSMKIPENALEVRSFVGLAHWFQEHVKGLAWNITALNKLAVSGLEFK